MFIRVSQVNSQVGCSKCYELKNYDYPSLNVQILAYLVTKWMILGKIFELSVPWFVICKIGMRILIA